jgi:hypothetical protein
VRTDLGTSRSYAASPSRSASTRLRVNRSASSTYAARTSARQPACVALCGRNGSGYLEVWVRRFLRYRGTQGFYFLTENALTRENTGPDFVRLRTFKVGPSREASGDFQSPEVSLLSAQVSSNGSERVRASANLRFPQTRAAPPEVRTSRSKVSLTPHIRDVDQVALVNVLIAFKSHSAPSSLITALKATKSCWNRNSFERSTRRPSAIRTKYLDQSP